MYRPNFNYMFLHLWFFFHVKSLSLKSIALIAWGKYSLLRIMYQICFILVRISFFPCKPNYTVILSAETLGRKSLLWIPRKFPLITFRLYCRLQDSDTTWNQAIQNQCLSPKRTVGPRNVPFEEILPLPTSPQEHSKHSHLTEGSFFFSNSEFYVPRFQHFSTHTQEKITDNS